MRKQAAIGISLLMVVSASPAAPHADAQKIDPEVVKIIPLVVNVPAGTSEMGSKEKGGFLNGSTVAEPDEQPLHKVALHGFWMGRFEVTNAQYKSFVDATGHRPPDIDLGKGTFWQGSSFPSEIANQPVVGVSWDDAVGYCKWVSKMTGLTYRLPTESEWERAARGGLEGRRYPFLESMNTAWAWYSQTWRGLSTLKPAEWGKVNGYGIYGMSGNAAEWCADWYDANYYSQSPSENPPGPSEGKYRVVRGGSWADNEEHLRVSYRDYRLPETRDMRVGFRVVREFK